MSESRPNERTEQVNHIVDEIWPPFVEKSQTTIDPIMKGLSKELSGLAKGYADSIDEIYRKRILEMPSEETDSQLSKEVNGVMIPKHLLERSRKRRRELNGDTFPEGNNALLSLGLSEQFNDCSIAAASACKNAHERIEIMAKQEEFVFLGEEGNYGSVLTQNLTPVFALPSGRKIRLVLGKSMSDIEAPLYLFAVTRDDLAIRLASFQRRHSNILCDYVKIGEEMDNQDFIVTPEDENLSRLDIIEHIRALTDLQPVDLDSSYTREYASEPTTLGKVAEVYDLDSGKNRLAMYQIIKCLTDLKIVDEPTLLAERRKAALDGNELVIAINRRRKNKYQRFAEQQVADELANESDRSLPENYSRGLYSDDSKWLHAVVKMYKNQNHGKVEAQTLARELGVEEKLSELLGSTTSDYEHLFEQSSLPRLAQLGTRRGIRPNVQVGKVKTDSDFELNVTPLSKSGFRVMISGRPDSMEEHGFQPFYTVDCYRDRPPSNEALASAHDILDLVKHLT